MHYTQRYRKLRIRRCECCGDPDYRVRPRPHGKGLLCNRCDIKIPPKVSRKEFELEFWGESKRSQSPEILDTTWQDYLYSPYATVSEFQLADTME